MSIPRTRSIDAVQTDGTQDIILSKRNGKAIRFKETDVRPMALELGLQEDFASRVLKAALTIIIETECVREGDTLSLGLLGAAHQLVEEAPFAREADEPPPPRSRLLGGAACDWGRVEPGMRQFMDDEGAKVVIAHRPDELH